MKHVACTLVLAALSQSALAKQPELLGPADCRIVHPAPEMKLSATWTGGCKNGFAEGRGTLEFISKRKVYIHYEGDVRQGAPDGQGYLRNARGTHYEGGFRNGEFDGTGTKLTWEGRYDGQFKEGEFHGRGKMTFTLGGSYDGDWKENAFHGKGRAVYVSGRTFEGEFIDGVAADHPQEQQPERTFKVRSREPGYGTRLHYTRATGSGIPFDKAYHQMTPAEQAAVREPYPLLDKDDEPPYPLKGTKKLYTRMSEALGALQDEGNMLLFVDVDSTGKATRASVYETPSPELAKVAMVIALQEKYKPGLCAGKPCAMKFPISMNFGLID